MKVFIYTLTEPDGLTIRYVGKSNEFRISKRLIEHCRYSGLKHHTHKNNWIKSLLNKGFRPHLNIIEECNEETYREREKYWVSFYKAVGCDLTNGTVGGEGACRINNRVITEIQKQHIRETLKLRYKEHPEMYKQCSDAGKRNYGNSKQTKFVQTSTHVGVSFMKTPNRWRAYTRNGPKQIHIGLFKTEQEAITAYETFMKNVPALAQTGTHLNQYLLMPPQGQFQQEPREPFQRQEPQGQA
jgi:hypothetical protein